MYVPAHFAADDGLVSELLTRHGAADLVTNTSRGLLATMLPFIYDPAAGSRGALLGHVARNNDQWKVPSIGESLAITRIKAKAKLSQNRPQPDIDGVIAGLRAEGLGRNADDVERARPPAK